MLHRDNSGPTTKHNKRHHQQQKMPYTTQSSSSPPPQLVSILATFNASIRSVGTACTLASVGVYLHRRGFIEGDGKRTLALISQQVTFPLFLFTKIIYCNQDWSDDACPDVTQSLEDVWMLLFWPAYVVGMGILVGSIVARICQTPKPHVKSVLAAIGFANSTGLPITLLTVVHTNFPSTSKLGRIDPTLFLSVYLLLYPVLQWGIGGWMLAPDDDDDDDNGSLQDIHEEEEKAGELETTENESTSLMGHVRRHSHAGTAAFQQHSTMNRHHRRHSSISESLRCNVLNNLPAQEYYHSHRHGLVSSDEGLYISELNLASMDTTTAAEGSDDRSSTIVTTAYGSGLTTPSSLTTIPTPTAPSPPPPPPPPPSPFQVDSIWDTLQNIAQRCLQPPVVGALTGIIVAIMPPVRGIFVDMVDRGSHAPLQWLFDGLYTVGQTAVPINMMILGCNLSAAAKAYSKRQEQKRERQERQQQQILMDPSLQQDARDPLAMPFRTMVGVIIGKMIVMPMVGFLSAFILQRYILVDMPDEISGAFYLVILIVFLTPTANNVMVMIELASSSSSSSNNKNKDASAAAAAAAATKEGIASVIALQYACAPIILGCTMTIAIGMASQWS